MQSDNPLHVVEVNNVHKSFKTVHAVRGIHLKIREGQFIALLGPNGAGKTTLVEMIEGIQKPDKGEIRILGKHWEGHSGELHYEIGLSLQETRFIDKLTTWETLRLFASFYSLEKTRVSEILSLVGLEEKRNSFVVNLSGGQRQRLALGIALLNKPKILILDEPTTGLDPNARREIWSILLQLKKSFRTTLVLTTHYMEEAEYLCDYIIILDQGIILREGTLEKLIREENDEKTIEFTLEETGNTQKIDFEDAPFPIEWDARKNSGSAILHQVERQLPSLISYLKEKNLSLANLEWHRKTLDDLFTSLTGRHLNE